MKRFIHCLALAAAGSIVAAVPDTTYAQAYPRKPVRIIIPFSAGGGVDTVARVLAQKLGESTRQGFVVDNRPGASGNIAFEFVAKSEPDGYTLLATTPSIVINPTAYGKVAYKVEDFVPISLLGRAALLMVAHPSLPAQSIPELVKLAKAKPGAIRYGSGIATTPHLAIEMLRMMAGIELLHVPYKGGPPALHDVMSGQIELTVLAFAETLPQVRAKRVKALAQTGDTRSPLAPDIPTVHESGIKGYSATTWYVVFAPARTPSDVITKLHAELVTALKLPDVQERLKLAGVGEIIGSTPEQAAQFVKSEATRYEKVIRVSGAKIE